MSDQSIICGACGATNAANAVICTGCGALLAAYATPTGAATASASETDSAPAPTISAATPPAPAAVSWSAPIVADEPAPPEPRVIETAASAAAPPEPDVPTQDNPIVEPATEPLAPPDKLTASEFGSPAAPTETQVSERTTPPLGPAPGAAPPADRTLDGEQYWQHQRSTLRETLSQRQGWSTLTHRLGQAPMTGLPGRRLDAWGPRQMLTSGLGLLLGSCFFLAMGSAVPGGGCLIALAGLGAVVGALLLFTAARSLFGSSSDW